ncbi:MAG: hypothetical protein GWO24_36085, partial [Akkermansiaceae bacterium]|nr:hypothetical protein [Akkermansiaceae bacterium]
DLDQSEFDVLNIAGLKFFVDEIRIGTTFDDVVKGGVAPPVPLQLIITDQDPDLDVEWESQAGTFYVLRSSTDPEAELATWESVEVPGSTGVDGVFQIATTPPLNTHTIPRPDDRTRFYRVEEHPLPPVEVLGDDFENGIGGWTAGSAGSAGTAWELGQPTVVGP